MSGNSANRTKTLIALHLLIMVYSMSGILSKLAARFPFFSFQFVACYAGMIAILGLYAIGWQQVIKRMPLTSAYANRAVTVIWGILWGILLFNEQITIQKVLGAALVLVGVAIFATADEADEGEAEA